MSKIFNISRNDDLRDVARKWFLKLEDETGNDLTLELFEKWVNADESHRDAFNSVIDFWSHIDSLPEIQEIRETGASIPGTSPQVTDENIIANFVLNKPVETTYHGLNKWRKWAMATTFLIICTAAIIFYNSYLPEGTYQTATGELQVIHLADGSMVYLNTHSKFRVEFSDKIRKTYLLEGEARFDVVKNKERPFIVETSQGNVRAVGTSFNINDSDENVEVIVFEGIVAVSKKKHRKAATMDASKPNQPDVLVKSGERIVAFNNKLSIVHMADELELSQKNAWRDGKLIFRGQKLSTVIKEMSRYTNKKIFISDDSLSKMKLGGAFDIKDFDALLHAIEDTFPVKIIRFTPYITIIIET